MKTSFGSEKLIKCLICLGFVKQKSTGSSHIKYSCPKKVVAGQRPFIEVILKRKTYDPHTASSYLRQIKNLGYTKDEVLTCLVKK